jgi:hypothetical protein
MEKAQIVVKKACFAKKKWNISPKSLEHPQGGSWEVVRAI